MANWTALQEQLTGKRVVKRAKHSIHFDNGNGSITANFSGKPCHFQDTDGLWKPIDTGLLLAGDGWYGSPHSDVKIHKDGRVKVGGYQQKSTLVNAKEGVVDGDKIVREFKFGTQYLYMTENGFRQETVIDRTPTTAEAKYLIASESGTLDSKYKRSDITAVDADGDVHEFINLGQFKKWLDGAVYPVVIDPDFSTTSTAGDTTLNAEPNRQARNYGALTYFVFTTLSCTVLLRFDCSSIDATATCTAVNMKFYKTQTFAEDKPTTLTLYSVAEANGDWIEGTGMASANAAAGEPCYDAKEADGSGGVTTAWAGSEGCRTSGTDFEATSFGSVAVNKNETVGTEYTITFNASGIARVENWFGSPNTNYGLCMRNTGSNITTQHGSSENTTTGYRPVLSVTYTAAATGALRRTNMNAQMQSLTGGFN